MSGICSEGDCIYQEMLMTCPDNWSKFGKKYRRRPSGCYHSMSRRVAVCFQAKDGVYNDAASGQMNTGRPPAVDNTARLSERPFYIPYSSCSCET
ncbi:hypothetical protein TNCV_4465231 [Trichonephila clavipes]|nr:hypothetical protein TNCV_4465231 [Trichonephila clavipes]